jgi:hypothetical protein
MKAYLIITGVIFGLMALLHLWRAIAEWSRFATNPAEAVSMAVLGLVAAGLSGWAWRLLRPARS